MAKLFQIYEDDLSELERVLPQIAQAIEPSLNNKQRVQLRRTQTILSRVRWDYGPNAVTVIPAGGETDQPGAP